MTGQIESADDLRARIREIATNEPDPARITHKILGGLDAAEAHVVVAVTLHDFVRRTIAQPSPVDGSPHRTYETQSGKRTPSAYVAAMRDWVDAELRRSVCVNLVEREWKHLADCTADDLLSVAAHRRAQAASTVAEAERHERIAQAVEEAGVDTVGDLDRATLKAVLR